MCVCVCVCAVFPGGAQLFLLLLTVFASYAVSCMPCWMGICVWKSDKDIKGKKLHAKPTYYACNKL